MMSSAVSGLPSCHVIPGRSRIVQFVASLLGVTSFARTLATGPVGPKAVKGSKRFSVRAKSVLWTGVSALRLSEEEPPLKPAFRVPPRLGPPALDVVADDPQAASSPPPATAAPPAPRAPRNSRRLKVQSGDVTGVPLAERAVGGRRRRPRRDNVVPHRQPRAGDDAGARAHPGHRRER